MRRRVNRRLRGALSLLEASVAIGLVGTALAIYIPTFFRELRTSKVGEATEMIELIAARASTYFAQREGGGRCLPPPAGPTPALPSAEAVEVDFQAAPPESELPAEDDEPAAPSSAEVWEALAVEAPRNLRFRYSFQPEVHGCRLETGRFVVRAEGDLDDDGELSTYEQAFTIEGRRAVADGPLRVQARVE
ncbi:MAG: hypothetical protein AAF411_11145 [Myxococcota bacterium]